jgi:hypothetical protein
MLCLCLGAPGCGKKEEPKGGDGKTQNGGKSGKQTEKLVELDNKEWGTLTGVVTFDGTPPEPKKLDSLPAMKESKDQAKCHDGATEMELIDQTWLVNKDKGVANVIVYLKPPEGKFFKIHESYLKKKDNFVKLHQPHCVFIPHALAYWASYYDKDTDEQKPSGQKLIVENDAKFSHNTSWTCDEDFNSKGNLTIAPGDKKELKFNADLNTPISFKCDIHGWMNAKCWALDNPYFARTDENGKFTIENVPAGVELRVVAWHEGPGFFYGEGKDGKKMTLEKTNDLKIPIKAK